MPENLEQKVNALDRFVSNTVSVSELRMLIDLALPDLGYGYAGGLGESFKAMKEFLSPAEINEADLMDKYDQLMLKGKYKQPQEYLKEMAAEVRKIRGLPETAPVCLEPESPEWNQASTVIKKRVEDLVEATRIRNSEAAIETALKILQIRSDLYFQLLKNRDSVIQAWNKAQNACDYAGKEDMSMRQGKFVDYLDAFKNELRILVKTYPHADSLPIMRLMLKQPEPMVH